jgi:hypothetical protein
MLTYHTKNRRVIKAQYQNNYSNTMFISVHLPLGGTCLLCPSHCRFRIRSVTPPVLHTHTSVHAITPLHQYRTHTSTCNHSTPPVPHTYQYMQSLHLQSTRMSSFHRHYTHNQHALCQHSTTNMRIPSIHQYSTSQVTIPLILHTHVILPPVFHLHACHHFVNTPYLFVIILTTCHHSTSTPHFIFHKYPHTYLSSLHQHSKRVCHHCHQKVLL